MSLITVPCAVCRGTNFALVYPATIDDPDGDPAAYYSSSRKVAGHLDIVRCSGCGLLMTNPRDDDATLARVYAGLRDTAYDAEDRNRRRTARSFLELVERYRPERGRLLDVGCATGLFVAAAQEAGWDVTGLEASAWAVQRARARSPRATYVNGLLEEVECPGPFDVVTLWDVLEHVRSPTETLGRVRQWLTPEGWLFLNLPDSGSQIARFMGRRWVLLLREHLWYFDANTVGRMLQNAGFELIATSPNWVRFSLANVLTRLAQYRGSAGRVAGRLARARLAGRLNAPLPIGEMRVAARVAHG